MAFFIRHDFISAGSDAFRYCESNMRNNNFPEFEQGMLGAISIMLATFLKDPKFWDTHCSVGIEDIGSSFLTRLRKLTSAEPDKSRIIELLYTSSFRLFYEGYLASGIEFSSDEEFVIDFTKKEINNFSERAQGSIQYITRDLSTHLFRTLMSSQEFKDLKGFTDTISSAKSLTKDWNDGLDERIQKAENLKQSIEGYTDAFNFVGLHQGFDQLHRKKITERNRLIGLMFFLAIIIMLPFGVKTYHIYFPSINSSQTENNKEQLNAASKTPLTKESETYITAKLLDMLPIISFAAILLYFFRVLLFNYKSICAQILQIELRMTLCRFIQHYSEHAAAIKKNSDVTLDRFETVIFSGLVSNDSDLPATFDGVEQLTSLFKTMKGN
ncbi:hypothetical protein SJU70_15650 [Aeromonas caviae]|uniref:hypothetical protein n=1 Tax=Aeromonas caviae TaxID=648 RepID=UPI0029D70189|nr:hypothetical protein [Aeromonas caviae]MDX7892671.1 hypothetical protein [Aeromonas caviae]